MSICLLALGSNLGDRSQNLDRAIELLSASSSIRVLRQSRRLETSPVGGPVGQSGFLNAAVLVETDESPGRLLALTQAMERWVGRLPSQRWDARPLDIDLLLFGDLTVRDSQLTLPHPWLPVRRFVLEPCQEIASEMRHPELGWTIGRMWEHLQSEPQRFVVSATQFDDLLPRICSSLACDLIEDPIGTDSDLAIPADDQAIELSKRRRSLVLKSSWCKKTAKVICGFWLGETEILVNRQPAMADRPAWLRNWRQSLAQLPPPKLLIYCRPPSKVNAPSDWPDWQQVICRDNQFPWLQIASSDASQFEDEIAAAFLSMQ
ncbi:MAG: 2-amino-4-hydroxy-6-hydroxymethyldihydropteridine diphosphokinase [Planctomycetaceae bacterium]|nr:2-amino-4-hydroxy-6-hydroxymethyldihydropteridine diphosphokinase [Planctomycetaceae bacterium]